MNLLSLSILVCVVRFVSAGCKVFDYKIVKLGSLPPALYEELEYEFHQHHALDTDYVYYYQGFPNGDPKTRWAAVCFSPEKGTPRTFCRNVTIGPDYKENKNITLGVFRSYLNGCERLNGMPLP